MDYATIYFSDKSTLKLTENDLIIPIIKNPVSEDKTSCMDNPKKLYTHVHDGLIPSIMDALCHCQFFYVNNPTTVYCSNSIVKIENN